MSCLFLGYLPIIERSNNINNSLQIPQIPKKRLFFVGDDEKMFSITDLDLKKIKRGKKLEQFKSTYLRLFKEKKVSIWLFIVDAEKQNSPSKFLQGIKTKFNRKSIAILGVFWQRDIGDNKFKLHYHILIATTVVSEDAVQQLYKPNKTYNDFKFEFCKYLNAFTNYLRKKEVFGSKKKKSWGSSKEFKKPML
jgi:hypothetical protein